MAAALMATAVVAPASAQTALVAVSHSDPDGVVTPGETVRVRVLHSRNGISILAGIVGSLTATDDAQANGDVR